MFEDFQPLQRLTYNQKKASDFKWAEGVIDYYDSAYGGLDITLTKKQGKYNINYDLANGRADIHDEYSGSVDFTLGKESVKYGLNQVHHYPIINQIVQEKRGQWGKRPLTPTVYDASSQGITQRKRENAKLIQSYLQETLIQPEINRITQGFYSENGIEDPSQLNQEQQAKAQEALNQKIEEGLQGIDKYIKKNYRSPAETQSQKILNYLMKEERIKEKTDDYYEHLLCTGEGYFYTGIRHNRPTFEKVNPSWFEWGGSSNTEFCEDGEYCKYVQYITISDFFNKYGDILKASDIKKLPEIVTTGGVAGYDPDNAAFKGEVILEIDRQYGSVQESDINLRTRSGQQDITNIYAKIAESRQWTLEQAQMARIREVHITWRSLRKLVSVKRLVNGKVKHYYRDEHYEFDALKGDIEVKTIWVPEIWEGRKFGGKEGIYLEKRPLPYQYRSLSNPFNVKHPYVGQRLNSLMGNSENSCLVDLGKIWNLDFDILQARIKEKMATDIGKVFVMVMDLIPEGYTPAQWLMALKYGKIAPIQMKELSSNGVSAQIIKEIDLTQSLELEKMINTLQYLQNQTAISMMSNPSTLGQVSPYATTGNNQQNIQQSSNQMEKINSSYSNIIERALNNMLKAARIAFKENDEVLRWVLNDGEVAELEIDSEMLDRSEMGVFITNDWSDIESTSFIKQNTLSLIQAQYPVSAVIKISNAKSVSEMLVIAEEQQELMEKAAQQKYQQDLQVQKQSMDSMKDLEQMRSDLKLLLEENKARSQKENILLDREKFALGADADHDGVVDANKRKDDELEMKKFIELEKIRSTERIEMAKITHQTNVLAADIEKKGEEIEIAEEELEIDKQEANTKEKIANKPVSAKK